MNDEKEAQKIAHDALSGSLSEGKLIEQIVAHGKSCYERGLLAQDLAWTGTSIEKDGKRVPHDEFFKSAKELELEAEITRLKERVAELEARWISRKK